MPDFCLLTLLALLFEAAVGYPAWLWRAIGHPVSWVGHIIDAGDRRLNRADASPDSRQWRGGLLLAALLLIVGLLTGWLHSLMFSSTIGFLVLAVLASTLLAQRSLHSHVADVANALDRDLPDARTAVAQIVGRDVAELDAGGVARAAIESLAENFSDGVVAPAMWMALAGLPGAALYKTINTADSMIGHLTPRHADFGMAAARLDDVVNWPAARLSGVLLVGAAGLMRGASVREAWRTMSRDAARHRSPNAGWPEAAAAGALGLQLAGPRVYEGQRVRDAFMGEGRRDASAQDVRRALALYRRAVLLLWGLLVALALLLV